MNWMSRKRAETICQNIGLYFSWIIDNVETREEKMESRYWENSEYYKYSRQETSDYGYNDIVFKCCWYNRIGECE